MLVSQIQIKPPKPRVWLCSCPCVGASSLTVLMGAKTTSYHHFVLSSLCSFVRLGPFLGLLPVITHTHTHTMQTSRVGSSEHRHVTEAVCMASTRYHPVNCLFTGSAHKNRRTGTLKHHFTHTIQTHSHRHRGTDSQSQDCMTGTWKG